MDLIPEGTYTTKVSEYGITEPKEGQKASQAFMVFEVDTGMAGLRKITWFGSLTDKAMEYTARALLTAGMRVDNLSALCKPGAFDDKQVSIVIEHEEFNEKTRAKVKWVNDVSGAKFKTLTPEIVEAKFGNLTGYFKNARKELGMKPNDFAPAKDDFQI